MLPIKRYVPLFFLAGSSDGHQLLMPRAQRRRNYPFLNEEVIFTAFAQLVYENIYNHDALRD
jgi:hypothetical protein